MSTSENNYVMGSENAAEMARLINQDLVVTENMGGLLAELDDEEISAITDVLDIACGPGGWTLETARAYPHMRLTGIDISRTMIDYANALAEMRGLSNIQFDVLDATQPLAFPSNTFDFVNIRMISGFMGKDDWPKLMRECLRVLRPGGLLRLTEWEGSITNSPAMEKLNGMINRAGFVTQRTFSPDGRHIGITPMLRRFLTNAGFVGIRHHAFAIDFSADSDTHEGYAQNTISGYEILRPFLTRLTPISDEEYKLLYQQMLAELSSDDFCGLAYHLTVLGHKPA